jgi:hypothetical protein
MVARASLSLFSPLFFINKPFARIAFLNTGANIEFFFNFKIFFQLLEILYRFNINRYTFVNLLYFMEKRKISETKVILFTAAFVVFAGLIRYFAYSFGSVLFYLAFAPFILYRFYSIKNRSQEISQSVDTFRTIVLVLMVITLMLNILGWQEADFFLIFLLMVDYLLVINKRF